MMNTRRRGVFARAKAIFGRPSVAIAAVAPPAARKERRVNMFISSRIPG
jgi:hypothetical protein